MALGHPNYSCQTTYNTDILTLIKLNEILCRSQEKNQNSRFLFQEIETLFVILKKGKSIKLNSFNLNYNSLMV